MEVDVPTFKTVREGYCVPGCGVEMANLNCTFEARLFGNPYVFEEPPIEPPEIPPPEPMEEPPEIEPVEPPLEIPEFYEIPEIVPSEPPEMEYYYYIPVPEIEYEEYDFEEMAAAPCEPPPELVPKIRINIPITKEDAAANQNSLRYGNWSDCSEYCSSGIRIKVSFFFFQF